MDRGVVLFVSGASATLHVPFILIQCAFMSFHFFLKLWTWRYGLAGNRVQQMVIAKLSLIKVIAK